MSEVNAGGLTASLSMDLSNWTKNIDHATSDAVKASGVIGGGLVKAGAVASGALGTLGDAAKAAAAQVAKIGPSRGLLGVGEGFKSVAGIAGTLSPRIGQLVSAFTAIDAAAKSTGASFGLSAVAIGGFVGTLATARAAFNFTAEGVKLAADMEQVSIAFATMIGDAGEAKSTLNDLKTFANTTPFQFPEIANAGKQLLAMGIPARDLVATLRRPGDVSSGLAQPLGDMAYLFGQIRSQGHAMTQDLNQFAGRGVPIYRELAAVMKTTEGGVRDLATAGKIGFPEIEAAFQRMTDAGGQFHDMTLRQAKSLKGEISTLSDTWDALKTTAGEAFIGKASSDAIEDLTAKVAGLTPSAERLGEALRNALMAAVPLVKRLTDDVTTMLDIASGEYGKKVLTGSANPSTGRGIEGLQVNDAAKLAEVVKNLRVAHDRLAGGLDDVKGFDLNFSKWGRNSQEVSPATKAAFDRDAAAAANSTAAQAAQATVDAITAKIAKGQPVSDDEFKAAKAAVAALATETDTFRQTMSALKLELIETDRYFAEHPLDARLKNLRFDGKAGRAGNVAGDAAAVAANALDDTKGTLAAAADALRASRNAEGADAAAEKGRRRDAAALDKRDRPGFDMRKGDGDPAILATIAKDAKAAADVAEKAAKQQAEKDKKSAAEVAGFKLSETIANLNAQGRAFDASMVELEARWKERIDHAVSEEGQLTAKMAYEAEKREAIARESARKQREAERGPSRGSIGAGMAPLIAAALPTTPQEPSWKRIRRKYWLGEGATPSTSIGDALAGIAAASQISVPSSRQFDPWQGTERPSETAARAVQRVTAARVPRRSESQGTGISEGDRAGGLHTKMPIQLDEAKLAEELGPIIAKGLEAAVQKHVGQLRGEIEMRDLARRVRKGI